VIACGDQLTAKSRRSTVELPVYRGTEVTGGESKTTVVGGVSVVSDLAIG